MKSPITHVSSAAAVIVAATIVIMHVWVDGTGTVLAAAAHNVEQVNSSIFREKRVFTRDGGQLPILNSGAVCYYSAQYGEREDMYSADGTLIHQMFWLPRENVCVRIIPPLKQYERRELSEMERRFFEASSIQGMMELLKAKSPTSLGHKMIDGRKVEGFEIAGADLAAASPVSIQSGVARFWIDVETRLPLQYEAEMVTRDKYVTMLTGGKPVLIQTKGYEPEWNVEIEPGIFEPEIPPDYREAEGDSDVLQPAGAGEDIPPVYIRGEDSDGGRIEMWAEVNPDTGLMTNFNLHQIDKGTTTISTPRETYSYDRNANVVTIKDGPHLVAPFRIGRLAEDMKKLAAKMDGRVEERRVFDPTLQRDVLVLEVTGPRGDVKAIADVETGWPIRFEAAEGLYWGRPIRLKSMEIRYEERLPNGMFDFDIPEGATVVRDTIETEDQIIPLAIIQYASKVYTESTQKTTTWCNSRITVVDENMRVYGGSPFDVANSSPVVWKDEVFIANTDSMKMAVFDDKGNKVDGRLMQHRPLSPGRFRIYIKLDDPLEAGERRSFLMWDGYGRPCRKTEDESGYTLTMRNAPGTDCLESFILVLAPGVEMTQHSQEPASCEKIEGYTVYVWQDYIAPDETHEVNVELARSGQP